MADPDFVVVGAGVAGSIVAARLAAHGSVLVLEAGEWLPDGPASRDPARSGELYDTPAVRAYPSVPQPGLGGRTVDNLTGCAVGGSSAVNVALWVPGFPADYADRDWTPDRERAVPVSAAPDHPAVSAVRAAALAAGVPPADVRPLELTWRDGRRVTFADAYLTGPDAPTVRTGVEVVGVRIEDGTATGVRLADGSEVTARREVVLAAGALRTPHLLLLSGVGPADHLAEHGIDPVADLPVGDGLHEHVCVGLDLPRETDSAAGVRGLVLFTRSDPALRDPDIEIVVSTLLPGVLRFGVVALLPASRGTVRLASADPSVAPRIDPALLTRQADVDTLLVGARQARRISGSVDLPELDEAAVRRTAGPMFHPGGTAAIGPVLHPDLTVRGTRGLRVADASVIPAPVRGHQMAPTAAVAHRVADLMGARWQ